VEAQGFPERVTVLRGRLKLSQAEFGRRLGVGKNAVYEWESGKTVPRGETLARLAEMVGVSVEGLMRGAQPEPADRPSVGQALSALDAAVRGIRLALAGARQDVDQPSEFRPATPKRAAKRSKGR
jgi:transcriptional regulator with XRE-family HTH domain